MLRAGSDIENLLPRIPVDVVEAHCAVGCGRRSEGPKTRRIDPVLPDVLELRKKATEVEKRRGTEFIVDAGSIAKPRAVIPVFAHICAEEYRNPTLEIAIPRVRESRCGFQVIDAAGVPVVAAAKHYAQALFTAEALTSGRAELVEVPASRNWCVTAHANHGDVRLIGGLLGHQVHRPADGVALLVG